MQFQNQFAAVEMATPLDRMGSWKISPIITQPAGPQVLLFLTVSPWPKHLFSLARLLGTYDAKKKMNKQTNTIST